MSKFYAELLSAGGRVRSTQFITADDLSGALVKLAAHLKDRTDDQRPIAHVRVQEVHGGFADRWPPGKRLREYD